MAVAPMLIAPVTPTVKAATRVLHTERRCHRKSRSFGAVTALLEVPFEQTRESLPYDENAPRTPPKPPNRKKCERW
eukprot:748634-Amphidinium_carterae.1